jgi:arylsulfatase A-like enzyme
MTNLYSGLGLLGCFVIGLLLFLKMPNTQSITEEQIFVENKPNVIFILADDLGYGDLSCYGQSKFSTPNIDNLASEGLLFSQFYAGSTVCAPSRASLLTGLHTGHTEIRGNQPFENGQMPLSAQTFTLAKVFQNNGYTTGAFGKWGLGSSGTSGDPLHQGFDYFYGYHDQRLAHHYYPYYLWDNDKTIILENNQALQKGQYAPELIHQKALEFIDNYQKSPFFLFYPSILPHAELAAPQELIDKYIPEFPEDEPYKGLDKGPEYKKGQYGSQEHPKATFAAMIKVLDNQVGELVNKVKDLGLEENTIFVFTSDNGPHREGGAQPEFFDSNGDLKGLKRDLFEGGIRVPMIVKWQGKISHGSTTDHVSAFWDVMPTISDLLEEKNNTIQTDGISFLPTLLGHHSEQKKHKYLYWEFHEKNNKQAIRQGKWKLIATHLETSPKYYLYDLAEDPGETNNLVDVHKEKYHELKALFDEARRPSKVFKFDFEN